MSLLLEPKCHEAKDYAYYWSQLCSQCLKWCLSATYETHPRYLWNTVSWVYDHATRKKHLCRYVVKYKGRGVQVTFIFLILFSISQMFHKDQILLGYQKKKINGGREWGKGGREEPVCKYPASPFSSLTHCTGWTGLIPLLPQSCLVNPVCFLTAFSWSFLLSCTSLC